MTNKNNTSEHRDELKRSWMKKRIENDKTWIEDCNAWQILESEAAAIRENIKRTGRAEG